MSWKMQGSQRATLAAVAVLLAGSLLSFLVGVLDDERHRVEARNQALVEVSALRAQLEREITATFTVTEGIVHLIGLEGDLAPERFAGMASQAMNSARHIRNIVLAPDNTVSQVYPLAGNEAILGLSYRQLAEQLHTVDQARQSGRPVLAGPLTLVQGGQGLIQRAPVFTGEGRARHYWGVVSIVAKADSLLAAGGMKPSANLRLALRGKDGRGAAGDLIWGDDGIFSLDPVTMELPVPGGSWVIAALPRGGWPGATPWRSDYTLLGLAFTLACAAFAYMVVCRGELIRQKNAALSREVQERGVTEQALRHSQQTLNAVLDNAPGLIYVFDAEGLLVMGNRRFEEAIGQPRESLLGRPRRDFMGAEVAAEHEANDRLVLAERAVIAFEESGPEVGQRRTYLTNKCPMFDEHGAVTAVVGISADITERKGAEVAQRLAAAVLDSTAEGVVVSDAELRIISVNRAFTAITGYTEAEVLGRTPGIVKSERQGEEFYQAMWAALNGAGVWNGEVWNRRKNGEIYPEWLTINVLRDKDGRVSNYVGVFSDISALKHSQAELERLAHFDPLTHLPNRVLFHDRLQHALERADRYEHLVAVVLLDLDGFKTVNDSLGHPVGDRLLQQVAERLKTCVRVEDTVSRLGGDEFAIILANLGQGTDALEVIRKVLAVVQEPFDLDGASAMVTTSIGIAVYPADGGEPDELLRNADSAMYDAKEAGRNSYRFYQMEMTQRAQEKLNLERSLRRALENGEFEIWYQPQVNLHSGRLLGAEALIRWRDPENGLVSPDAFIPVAERTGLIIPIGAWVVEEVCAQVVRWREQGWFDGRVAINVSAPQIDRSDFIATLQAAMARHGTPPEALEIEVTESFIMASADHASAVLNAVQDLGITTAVDDFGTGYSSFAYLKSLPIDNLKIDRVFVNGLPSDGNDVAICRAIIAMAHSLGFRTIAEGVETVEQWEFLRQEGCDEGQGYLLSRPLPAAAFEAWLQAWVASRGVGILPKPVDSWYI